ncbi:TVP38/TMEM64 family protein [Paenibacillus piri]|uniref:TVP38/TMEM64 family membrane protein n=1 Tax=Paenibacillus piri TaxID=2547395 RepID=A0A4R5KLS1_9BACL|nr:TVP38/TMEM64 family protein [Paenibacillus piri]TDF96539.1 TVP38/TMEM64 family protein [Paenibacillus piri]
MVKWNVHHLSDILNTWGVWGHLAGALLAFVQTLFPFVPFVVVAGANVLIFGFWWGFIVNYAASVLGAVTAFWFARRFARSWVEKKLEKYAYLNKLNDKLERSGFMYIFILRIVPILPSFVINMGAAVMKIRSRDFILGTVCGKLPMILLESYIGHDLLYFHQNKRRLLLLSVVFIGLILIGNSFKNKWFGSKTKT